LFGKAKYDVRDLILRTSREFDITVKRPVPHITLVGGFYTNDEAGVIRDFESISSKYGLINYVIEGVGAFTDTCVVYLDVQPSEHLIAYRREIRDKLQRYCK